MEEECGDNPGEAYGVGHREEGPFPAATLVADGDDGGETGHIEEDEEQHGGCREGRHVVAYQS